MMTPKKAKEHCGYMPKPVLPTCGNCRAFASDRVGPTWMLKEIAEKGVLKIYGSSMSNPQIFKAPEDIPDSYKIEVNMRCADHGFATKRMASCKLWRAKP